MSSKNTYSRFEFKKQFIICSSTINIFSEWTDIKFIGSDYNLFIHPDLRVFEKHTDQQQFIILGICKDHFNLFDEDQILDHIVTLKDTESYLAQLTGKYIIIRNRIGKEIEIYGDTTGQKELVYYNKNEELIIASQSNLIKKYFDLNPTQNSLIKELIASEVFKSKPILPGNLTPFEGTYRLRPNFKLRFSSQNQERYWPKEKIEPLDLPSGIKKISDYLKSSITQLVSEENGLCMAVTAGYDSRLLLAASKEKSSQIDYFIFKHQSMAENDTDIIIPNRLLESLDLNFNVIEYNGEVPKELKKVNKLSLNASNDHVINVGYNGFYKNFGDKISISSVSEVVRNYYDYDAKPNKITGKILSKLAGYGNSMLAQQIYQDWISETKGLCETYHVNVLDLFYWEEMMGNALSRNRTNFDPFIEEYSPFNCREIIQSGMGIDRKHRGRYDSTLMNGILDTLWPETRSEPINPSKKNNFIRFLISLRLYRLYKKVLLIIK